MLKNIEVCCHCGTEVLAYSHCPVCNGTVETEIMVVYVYMKQDYSFNPISYNGRVRKNKIEY